ncbi:MAG TPA: glycosyltransferase, partial [Myxococcota bacterium]|nr:glycosyltransferase [Myxococcota bacterium]
MLPMTFAVTLASLVTLLLTTLAILAVYRQTRRSRLAGPEARDQARAQARYLDNQDTRESRHRPVTILKPLCGADDDLEGNLETFFLQDHPDFELVFGVEGEDDPAIPIVRRLRARYPGVRSRLVIHRGGRGLNPKVNNLEQTLSRSRPTSDLLVISDSNVAVPRGWLTELSEAYAARPGLVMNLFIGRGEETLGATLENLHLAGPVAGSLAFADRWLKKTDAVGKSMMFSRATFEALGGFASVSTVLAEDFVMGRMFSSAGYPVTLAKTLVHNVTRTASVRRFLARQLRWNLIRSRMMGWLYPFEPLASPLLPTLLSPLAGEAMPLFFGLGLALTLLRDGLQWVMLRGKARLLMALPLGPAKELALLFVWAIAP